MHRQPQRRLAGSGRFIAGAVGLRNLALFGPHANLFSRRRHFAGWMREWISESRFCMHGLLRRSMTPRHGNCMNMAPSKVLLAGAAPRVCERNPGPGSDGGDHEDGGVMLFMRKGRTHPGASSSLRLQQRTKPGYQAADSERLLEESDRTSRLEEVLHLLI